MFFELATGDYLFDPKKGEVGTCPQRTDSKRRPPHIQDWNREEDHPGPHRRVARRPANEGTQGTSQSWEVHASNRPKEFALSGRYSKVPLAVQHGTGDTCRVWHRKDFFNNAAKLKHIKKLKRAPEAELAHTCRAFSSCAAMLSAGCGLWRASSRRSTAGKKPRPWRQGAEKRHVLCSYCAAMRCVLLCFSSYTLPFEGLVSLYSYLLTARWRTSSCRC